jgi:hypothetical protein
MSSTTNCGTCGKVCPAVANATSYCSNGVCGFNCSSGYGNCDGNSSNGCETNVRTSPTNCGGCGTVCPARPNATMTCANGVCGFTCNLGFGNCDGNALNGCEVDLRTSTTNCGACGVRCAVGQTCSAGRCM